MKAKHKKLLLILIVAAVLVLAGAVAAFVCKDAIKSFAAGGAADIQPKGAPRFVLDAAQFPDWATPPNTYHNDTQGAGYTVAFSATQCAPGSRCNDLVAVCAADHASTQCGKLQQLSDAGHCMVHFYYMTRPIDPDTARADFLKTSTDFKGEVREIASKTLSISTPDGNKTYQLHQYHSKSSTYKNGVSLGYIPLENGHVEIKGICDKSDQLDEVLPVIEAVRLEA